MTAASVSVPRPEDNSKESRVPMIAIALGQTIMSFNVASLPVALGGKNMSVCVGRVSKRADQVRGKLRTAFLLLALPAMLAACGREPEVVATEARPVRTVTVEKREASAPITLTGRIEAEDQVALAFRISGRLLENDGKLGDRVEAGQVVARLESQNEMNTLRSAKAESRGCPGPAHPCEQSFRAAGMAPGAGRRVAGDVRRGAAGAANGARAG